MNQQEVEWNSDIEDQILDVKEPIHVQVDKSKQIQAQKTLEKDHIEQVEKEEIPVRDKQGTIHQKKSIKGQDQNNLDTSVWDQNISVQSGPKKQEEPLKRQITEKEEVQQRQDFRCNGGRDSNIEQNKYNSDYQRFNNFGGGGRGGGGRGRGSNFENNHFGGRGGFNNNNFRGRGRGNFGGAGGRGAFSRFNQDQQQGRFGGRGFYRRQEQGNAQYEGGYGRKNYGDGEGMRPNNDYNGFRRREYTQDNRNNFRKESYENSNTENIIFRRNQIPDPIAEQKLEKVIIKQDNFPINPADLSIIEPLKREQEKPDQKTKKSIEFRINTTMAIQPFGLKCWPSFGLYIKKSKITFILSRILDHNCTILYFPYTNYSMDLYPGNMINSFPFDYRKKLKQKDNPAGKAYLQKCVGIKNFQVIAFAKIQRDNSDIVIESLKSLFDNTKRAKQLLPQSILIPYCNVMGSLAKILNCLYQQLESYEMVKQIIISTNNPSQFCEAAKGYLQSIKELAERNDLVIS